MSGTLVKNIGFEWMLFGIAILNFLYAPLLIILRNPPTKEEKKVGNFCDTYTIPTSLFLLVTYDFCAVFLLCRTAERHICSRHRRFLIIWFLKSRNDKTITKKMRYLSIECLGISNDTALFRLMRCRETRNLVVGREMPSMFETMY